MYSTVVVPLDGSTFAEEALELALFLSARSRADLLLVRVHESGPDPGYRAPAWDEFFRSEEGAYLETVASRAQAAFSGSVDWALLDGHVAPAICARAAASPSALVVMSTHGRTGIRRAWLGSIASGVVRRSSAPVLMVRPRSVTHAIDRVVAAAPFANIIAALDGSAFAAQVLPHAVNLACASSARLVLLRVVAPGEQRVAATREAAAYLDDVACRVRDDCPSVEPRVEARSSPGAAILECAQALERPLIAMASHGRGLSSLFLGSVADEVVRGTPGAVLMIRPRT